MDDKAWALTDLMIFIRNKLTIIVFLILSGASLLTTAAAVHAQEREFFFMERPKLGIDASYEFEEEKRENPSLERETTNHDLRESVTIGTNGWVYHPNLMQYKLSVEPEWRQEEFERDSSAPDARPSERRDTSILAYDAEATLLKQKPFSLDVFANKNTRRLDLRNVQDSEFESETLGARINLNNNTLPASLGVVNHKVVRTGFYPSEEERDEVRAMIRHNAKSSVTELSMYYEDTERTNRFAASGPSGSDSSTLNSELNNTSYFTSDERVRLDSLLYNTRAEYGESDYDTWVLSENLFWTHSDSLLTQYRFDHTQREFDSFESEKTALSAGLTHHLDNRLTTNLGSDIQFNDFDDGSEDSYRGNLDVIYNQPIPWGSVELGAGYTYGMSKRTNGENTVPTRETPVLSIGEETFLNKENILTETIVVTDANDRIVYTEGIDYRIQEIGSDVRISRTLSGDIEDGEQVIVRYSYRVDTGFDDTSFGQDYSFALELGSLFYFTYTHGRFDQNVISGEPFNDPIDDTYDTVRFRVDARWSETEFLYQDFDRSNGNSTITRSVRQLFNFRPFRDFSFNFSGKYGDREFPDTGDEETFYTLGAELGWAPKRWCNINLVFLQDRIRGDRQDMLYSEIAPSVKLTYGVWTGTIAYRLTEQEDHENDNSLWRQRIYFAVKRSMW